MKKHALLSLVAVALGAALSNAPALAHHSFAVYDFKTEVPFEGIVDTVKFRNPHIAITLKVKKDGKEQIVDFIEGAPANMLVRGGLRPEEVAPGKHISLVGSPLIEDPTKFFIRLIKLDDGREFKN